VTWRNFTPSTTVSYDAVGTNYPVMIAECKGTHPTMQSQCFGADNGGVQGSLSPYGPMNTQYATTSANGTGVADIQLLTAAQAPQLGCNRGRPCSLVIEPAQGGNVATVPPNCRDHSQDLGQTAVGEFAFSSAYGECSWHDRIIVPLRFAPTPTDCPVRNPNFSVIGSPMLARAMGSWQASLCSISNPVYIQYDSAQNEPLARQDFLARTNDVALTTLPAGASGNAQHPFVYAPVGISAESVAFWVDNPITGKPLNHLKLDARLVLKLLTQSYNFENVGCGHGPVSPHGLGCDNAVDNDPGSIFADPEFKQLNPRVAYVGDGFQVPTVLAGESDLTWELTRWIAADKQAKAFANGAFDPWGAHINTDYLNMTLPINTLNAMDPFPPIAHRYVPYFPMSSVAQYQVDNWTPGTDWQPDVYGNYNKLQPEIPGGRALFAVVDQADAAAYKLPVASLQNAAGRYVAPTNPGMAAALSDMKTASNHVTQELNFKNGSKKVLGAYPLTMVVYAMVPTRGISKKKAAKIAQWLDYVAYQGQRPGYGPGQLPPGYLPLTASMRAQTVADAQLVLAQQGNPMKKKASASASASASAATSPTASPTPSPSATGPTVSLGYDANPGTSGIARYAVPALLVAGGMLAVAGSFALLAGRNGAAAVALLRRARPSAIRIPGIRLSRIRLPGRKK
jgi:hypothetical protein